MGELGNDNRPDRRRWASLPRWAQAGLAVLGAAVLAAAGAGLARAVSGPTASFSYSPTLPTAGDTVAFSNQSSTATTVDTVEYAWDFGDGVTDDTRTSPTHVYTRPGVYEVTLAATEWSGTGTMPTVVGSDTTTGAVTVEASPAAPVDDAYPATENTELVVDATNGVLANDPEGSTAVARLRAATDRGGLLNLAADGSFTYMPPTGFYGIDTFQYSTLEVTGAPAGTATVTIGVVPTGPFDDAYSSSQGRTLTIPAPGVLEDDPAGSVAVEQTGAPTAQGGKVTLAADGGFTYTPPSSSFVGVDHFTYATQGGTATVTIGVTGPVPDSFDAARDTEYDSDPAALRANDPEGTQVVPQSGLATEAGGTVTIADDGSFVYTPPANYVGFDEFTYTTTDGNDNTGSAPVSILVHGVSALDDGPFDVAGGVLTSNVGNVLANDTYTEAGTATAMLNSQAVHGVAELSSNGSFSYTPDPGYAGPDSFTYTTAIGNYGSRVATVTLNVQQSAPANDDLANAISIGESSGTVTGDNTNATLEQGEKTELATADVETGKTVWWAWTAPSSGAYWFDTAGSAIRDPTLAVYTGSQDDVATLDEVTSDDDSSEADLQSHVTFVAVGGTTYLIAVGAYYDEEGGGITLTWAPAAVAAPANDLFAHAQALLGPSGSVDGTTVGATREDAEPSVCECTVSGTVWYSWSPAASGPATFRISGADAAAVYTGAWPELTPVTANVAESGLAELDFEADAGATYWIQVEAFPDGAVGPFTLSWQLASPPPANDDRAHATTLTGDSGNADGTTVGATTDEGEPPRDAAVANTVWYTWTPSRSGSANLTYVSAAAGSLAVYDGSLNSLGNDVDSRTLSVSFDVAGGVTYYVQVGTYDDTPAPFALAWQLDSGRTIQGTVFDSDDHMAAGVLVRACLDGSCSSATSDGNGGFSFDGLQAGNYSVEAIPSPTVGLAARMSVDTSDGNVSELSIRLAAVATSGGAAGPTAFTVSDCANGTLTYELGAGGTHVGSGSATGDANGHYRIDVSGLGHYAALTLTSTITCPESAGRTETSVLYTDPSGTVVDDGAGGVPLAGANVTLLHQDLTPVQPGDPSLSAATPANPETSDARGAWGWDVAPGTYIVFAEKGGCGSTTSSPVTVTRGSPQTGVVLHLNCARSTPPPPTTTTPPPLPPPTPGVNVNVTPVLGTVLVNGQPLQAGAQIPLGATIDATQGIIGLTTIGTTGQEQTMYFLNAAFVVTQAADGVTEIALQGGDFDICVAPKAARRTSGVDKKPKPGKQKPKPKAKGPRTVVRALWGEGKGSFRTQGRFSAATVRGTMWLTEDRCDGTYTKVLEGAVDVLDQVNNKHLTVLAGHSVLVRPNS